MKNSDFSDINERYYLHLLKYKDDITEEEKIKYIVKLLENDNKYYIFSYIITSNHELLTDWFFSKEFFISFVLNHKKIKKSYKMKLIREMLASNLIDDDKKYINSLK